MKNNPTLKLVLTALMAAMTCVATMIIKIPITATGGYINLGDCIVLLSGVVLGPVYGGLAASVGSALADILSGYAAFVPATFLIKGLMALVVGSIVRKEGKSEIVRMVLAGLIAECIMVGGYFIYEAVILGYGMGAAAGIVGNAIQGVVGIAIAILLMPVIRKASAEIGQDHK